MSTLTNQQINATYQGLIKTADNAAIDGTLKALEDGIGNALPIEVSLTGVNFTGTVDGVVQSIVAGTNVTVDVTDPANPIISAAGGGGGGTALPYSGGTGTGMLSNSGSDGPYTFFTNVNCFYPVYLEAGSKFSQVRMVIRTAFTGGDTKVALYSAQNVSTSSNIAIYGRLTPYQKLSETFIIPNTTGGFKTVSGTETTVPYSGVYYLGVYTPGVWDGSYASNTTALNNYNTIYYVTGIVPTDQTGRALQTIRWSNDFIAEYSNNPTDVSSANTNVILT